MSVATAIHQELTSTLRQDFSTPLVVSPPVGQTNVAEEVPLLFEYLLPTNDMSPSLPRGSLVTLRLVGIEDVSVGDVLLRVQCGPTYRKVLEIGRLKMPRTELYQAGCITLTRDSDGLTLFDNLPWVMRNIYWFRVEQVLSIARLAPYWPPASRKATA